MMEMLATSGAGPDAMANVYFARLALYSSYVTWSARMWGAFFYFIVSDFGLFGWGGERGEQGTYLPWYLV